MPNLTSSSVRSDKEMFGLLFQFFDTLNLSGCVKISTHVDFYRFSMELQMKPQRIITLSKMFHLNFHVQH